MFNFELINYGLPAYFYAVDNVLMRFRAQVRVETAFRH